MQAGFSRTSEEIAEEFIAHVRETNSRSGTALDRAAAQYRAFELLAEGIESDPGFWHELLGQAVASGDPMSCLMILPPLH